MNVMNRKLFANRNARRKLANMGGIMTSSPELMQAGQMFQVGGQIGSPTAQKVKTVKAPYSGIMYDVYTDGRVVETNSGRTLDPMNAVQATIINDVKALPSVTNENSGIIAASPVLDKELGSTTLNMALDAIDKRQAEGRISPADANFEKIIAMGRLSKIEKQYPEAVDYGLELIMPPIPPSEKNDESNPYQADIDAAVESFTGKKTYGGRQERDKNVVPKQGSATSGGRNVPRETDTENVDKPTVLPEIEVTGKSDETKSEITSTEKKNANQNLKNINSAISNLETGANVAEAGLSAALENSGVETKDLSLKQKVESMEDLFAGIFGETDEDTKKANLLTAAYTFFQIAAGASPNALTNIANGVTLGMEELMKRQQAGKDRKDKLKIMAVEQVFAEKAAEKDAQLRRELAAAKAGSGYRDPRNPIDAFLNAKSDAEGLLTDITFRKTLLEQNNVAPENQEAWLDQWSTNRAMKTVQSAYGSQTPEFGGTQTQAPESYFEANRPKNKGAVYTFDGVTYKNDEVTGKPSQISD
tara:strand:- start:400 stop:1995 length:1596 start_codon:yes stop_codon:yes gene_type:complete